MTENQRTDTELNAALYKRYAILRKLAQTGEWGAEQERELAEVEQEIWIPVIARVASLRELAG